MAEVDGIKIKITSDSDNVLKDLQKIEKQAQRAFERASAAVSKTENEIAVLEGRLREIAAQKRTELDIGVQWDSKALDEAVDRALGADKTFQRLSSRLDTLQMKWQTQKNAVGQASAAYEQASQATLNAAGATQKSGTIADKVKGVFSALADRLGALTKNSKKASSETKKHTRSMKDNKKAADPLSKSILRLGNMFRLMLLRMAMRKVIDAVKEGLADLAKYSDSFQGTMSRLSTSFLYVRNAITAAAKPALEALAPLIEQVADWFANAANSVAQFTAALFGNGNTYTQATKSAKEYGDATEKAAKKTDKAMASFDQINQLSFGKQEEAQTPSPDDMFEEAPIDEKVQGLADKFKAFFEQLKGDAGQVWAVFQQSWAQSGQTTVDAAKNALSSILGVLGTIGSTFKEVWTDGTGLNLLNNLQGLLQIILGIIGAIATAFTAAWVAGNAGTHFVQVIAGALNNIILLIVSIGQAFVAAWNQGGIGQSILSNIISIATGLVGIIGQLAGRFTEAWKAGGNGQAILYALLQIFNIVLGTIDKIVQATLNWASELNFEPLLAAIRVMLEALAPVVQIIGNTLAQMWTDIVLPFLTWVMETALPSIIDMLTELFNYLAENPDTLQTLIELVVAFIAAWKITDIITSVMTLIQTLSPLTAILTVLLGLVVAVAMAWNNMSGLERAVAVLGLLTVAALGAAIAVGAFQSAWTLGLAAAGIVAGIIAIVAAVNNASRQAQVATKQISSVSAGGFSGGLRSSNYDLRSAPVPRLATGAVIPPNNEFLAVLGDQKRGRNIEAPESAIEEAVARGIAANGGSGKVDVTLHLSYDQSFIRGLNLKLDEDSRRRGVKLVKGGAY